MSVHELIDAIYLGDAFDLLAMLPDASIDMVLCDLPYGTTANKWDKKLDTETVMNEFFRVVTDKGAVVLTCNQPFTTDLMICGREHYKEILVWHKNKMAGFLDANRKHLKVHEDVLVFCKQGRNTYNPQKGKGAPYKASQKIRSTPNYGKMNGSVIVNNGERFPQTILNFDNENTRTERDDYRHPTRKPVKLFEYLILTYSNPDDVVLDVCCGSGTTAIAARNTGRHFICGELDNEYYQTAVRRLNAPYTPSMIDS